MTDKPVTTDPMQDLVEETERLGVYPWPSTHPEAIARKWANDWYTIAPAYRTRERLVQQMLLAVREAKSV